MSSSLVSSSFLDSVFLGDSKLSFLNNSIVFITNFFLRNNHITTKQQLLNNIPRMNPIKKAYCIFLVLYYFSATPLAVFTLFLAVTLTPLTPSSVVDLSCFFLVFLTEAFGHSSHLFSCQTHKQVELKNEFLKIAYNFTVNKKTTILVFKLPFLIVFPEMSVFWATFTIITLVYVIIVRGC